MYEVKNTVFLNFTKRQKAALCAFLRHFVKNNQTFCAQDILYKFLDEEKYYYDIGNPHFYFVAQNVGNEDFLGDLKRYIEALLKDIEYKKAQKPYLDKQKELAKKQRRAAAEFKMKHEKPTPKQLKYYKNLCKNHNIEPKDYANATKFDLKTCIG
jgi:hypothetical protein